MIVLKATFVKGYSELGRILFAGTVCSTWDLPKQIIIVAVILFAS